MIELKNVNFRLNKNFSLENISMIFKSNMFHVLLGTTGSGKTVLLEIIAGLIKNNSGEVFINSENISKLTPECRNIAYLPQDNSLFPHLNVFDNIFYGLQFLKHLSKQDKINKVKELAKNIQIEHLLERKTENLSGGEKQRVALARALVVDKKILLLDEPTSAVHENLQEELCLFLKELQKNYLLTVIMTTHHRDSAFILADYIHFIDKGKILISSPKENFLNSIMPENVARFFGVSNILSIELKKDENGYKFIKVKDINLELIINKDLPDNLLFIGIKPEDIRVIKEDELEKVQQNSFFAKVLNILHKEQNAIIKIQPLSSERSILIEISIYHQKRLKIDIGKVIKCKIKEESVKLIY